MCTAGIRTTITAHVAVKGFDAGPATTGGAALTLTLPRRWDKPDPGSVPAWPVRVR